MQNLLGGLFGRPQSGGYYPPAPQQQPGMMSAIHGAPGQQRRGPTGLELLRDPNTALPIAAALLGGRNNRESFGNAFATAGDARQSAMQRQQEVQKQQQREQQKNATIQYLQKNRPDLAAQVGAGMPVAEAWKQIHAQPKAPSAKMQQISRLMSTGLTRDQAVSIADGRSRLSTDPVTGRTVFVDMGTGETRPTQAPRVDVTPPAVERSPQGQSLYGESRKATGVGPAIAGAATNTLGQIPGPVGDMFTAPQIVEAQKNLDLFTRNLVLTLSVNPKFPVAEQKRIEGLIPRGALTSAATLEASYRQLDTELARIEQQMIAGVNDPNAPIKQQQADQATLREVQAARQRIGIPQGEADGQRKIQGAPEPGTIQDGYRFMGGDPADPNSWERQ